MSETFKLHPGDCIATMRTLPEASVDAIVTDPPYELGFMGKAWDASGIANSVEMWSEALRVLKPGGHLLAFSGSRTYHRMVCAIEDAGFEIRDQIMWIYGSGFPKSLDVSKAIDKAAGAERERPRHEGMPVFGGVGVQACSWCGLSKGGGNGNCKCPKNGDPMTDAARQWQGWGTALKPAHEPIVVARKPLIGTVAANVLAHGTGALNIDGCRVGDEVRHNAPAGNVAGGNSLNMSAVGMPQDAEGRTAVGRWPANLIHDGSAEVLAAFPDSNGSGPARTLNRGPRGGEGWGMADEPGALRDAGKGSAARFFYAAKASKADRGAENVHPTVKPTDLMAYLVRLVTPPGGTVLDPFTGSGSTGKACMREGLNFIGCELSPEYLAIAQARIEHEQLQVAHRAYLDMLKAA